MAPPSATVEQDTQVDFTGLLAAIAGSKSVLTDASARVFYSTDIAIRGATAEAVVQVADVAVLSKIVAAATAHGRVVIPRGGGFSYTGGYTPPSESSVIVDMRP